MRLACATLHRINTIAPLAMIQALAPYLGEDARIVNITSDLHLEVRMQLEGETPELNLDTRSVLVDG